MLQRFSIWLNPKTIDQLKKISEAEERPVGWLVRKAVEKFVEEYKPIKK
jgi:predicted DNA-binding protein